MRNGIQCLQCGPVGDDLARRLWSEHKDVLVGTSCNMAGEGNPGPFTMTYRASTLGYDPVWTTKSDFCTGRKTSTRWRRTMAQCAHLGYSKSKIYSRGERSGKHLSKAIEIVTACRLLSHPLRHARAKDKTPYLNIGPLLFLSEYDSSLERIAK